MGRALKSKPSGQDAIGCCYAQIPIRIVLLLEKSRLPGYLFSGASDVMGSIEIAYSLQGLILGF